MIWKELNFICKKSDVEALEEYSFSLGACSVTFEDAQDVPILEPQLGETPLWEMVRITLLFTEEFDTQYLQSVLLESHPYITQLTSRTFPDEVWERTWMANFKPIAFGQKLWVCPSWETPPKPEAINIMLDPGLAFGTGTHETTALCLEWLDQNIQGHESVLDYGCGSGILAIAAKKLGAHEIYGIDIDPQAISAAHENAVKNDVPSQSISLFLPQDTPKTLQADIVVANILAGILIDLYQDIKAKVKPHGKIVLSGILTEQAEAVMLCYSQDFTMDPVAIKGDWVRLSGTKKC